MRRGNRWFPVHAATGSSAIIAPVSTWTAGTIPPNFNQPRGSVQADAADEIFEARIIPQGIEEGMHLEELQNRGLFLVRPL